VILLIKGNAFVHARHCMWDDQVGRSR